MKLTIESTDRITQINGAPCRHWVGVTEGGSPVAVFVARIAASGESFEREINGALSLTGEGDKPDGPSRPSPETFNLRHLL